MSTAIITRSELDDVDVICHAGVTRAHQLDACSKPATAVLFDQEHRNLWPACTWHANRCGGALTLAQLADIRATGATIIDLPQEPDHA